MNFKDIVTLFQCIFAHDQTSKNLPDAFENYTKKDQHNCKTRGLKMYHQNVLLDAPIKNI